MGNKILFKSNRLYIEFEDANCLKAGEKVTLMKWGNFLIESIKESENGSLILTANYLPDDKDFKSTKKINWLSTKSPLVFIFFSILFIINLSVINEKIYKKKYY